MSQTRHRMGPARKYNPELRWGGTYYHGSPFGEQWYEALRYPVNGRVAAISPDWDVGDKYEKDSSVFLSWDEILALIDEDQYPADWIRPRSGRVYLTRRSAIARVYAEPKGVGDPVVLKVELEAGDQVEPDEDCVGVALQYATTEGAERAGCPFDWRFWNDRLMEELSWAMQKLPKPMQDLYAYQVEPDIHVLAEAGKMVLDMKLLPPWALLRLAELAANISVKGIVPVAGGFFPHRGVYVSSSGSESDID